MQIGVFFTSVIFVVVVLPVIINILLKNRLIDTPGRRKIHKEATPSLGGLAIFFAFVCSSLVWIEPSDLYQFKYFYSALLIIFLVGIRDDLFPLSAYGKLFFQLVVSILLVHFFNLRITNLHGIFGIYEIDSVLSYILTIGAIVTITNSFNLIDGIDGLASSVAIINMLFYLFALQEYSTIGLIIIAMIGALAGFLAFNWHPAKIFMGDTGALTLGLFISVLFIYVFNSPALESSIGYFETTDLIALAIASFIIPLFDTIRIFIKRIYKGNSPFAPDKNHIHHYLLKMGFNHSQTTITLIVLNLFTVVLTLLLLKVNFYFQILSIIGLCTAFTIALEKLYAFRIKEVKRNKGETKIIFLNPNKKKISIK